MKKMLLVALCIAMCYFSCVKEDAIINPDQSIPVMTRSNIDNPFFSEVSVNQGVLEFPSQEYFDDAVDKMIEFEQQLAVYVSENYEEDSKVEFPYYDAIYNYEGPFGGLNPISDGELPELQDNDIATFDEDAIAWLFEYSLGFTSLRKKLVTIEQSLEAEGVFDPVENNPDDFFLYDDKLRTVLNTGLEIKVGTSIYKYASSTALIELVDGNYDLLDQVRSEFDMEINWQTEPTKPTIGIVNINPMVINNQLIQVHKVGEILDVQACAASFNAIPMAGTTRTYVFSNTSTGTYDSFVWDFGDGNSSYSANPTHTYAAAGSYSVSLILYDNGTMCDATGSSYSVNESCVACFTSSTNVGQVTFDANCSTSNSQFGYITDYSWDFDDTNTAQGINPYQVHNYTTNGNYNVCLTITTDDNCTNQFCDDVLINMECCKTNKTNKHNSIQDLGNNRGLKGKVWITSNPFYRRWGAKTKAFRRKNNGNWVKTKADQIYAGVVGVIWTDGCVNDTTTNLYDVEYDKKKVKFVSPGAGTRIEVKLNGITGNFRVIDNGIDQTRLLGLLKASHCD